MKISYNWLKEYISIIESAEEIGKVLTSTGLEVESVEHFETVKGGLKDIVIGEVLTCAKHPNADKLSLTTVDVGNGKIHPIVCGAANVAAGQKVVVALPGATLYPSKGEPFTIKSAKIRGEVSEGMICAEDEIGLGESHAGIIVLQTNVPNGTPASSFFNIQSDYVIEIGLTPNRVDAASHIGVARDIKASQKRELKLPAVDAFKVDNNNLNISVNIENKEACLRYSGLSMTGLTVKDSPDWLKHKLLAIGISPINNIVDITNFICHELGQPMHAFDATKIEGNKVVVKTLPKGTKFTTLDGKERELQSTDLMICNASKGMCIAGVFGGADSGISNATTSIFLESACFAPDAVRKTSLHHSIKTDSSFRFERGTDPNITVYALKRAALLIKEVAGGGISSDIVDVYPVKVEDRIIRVKDKNVNRLIGKALTRDEATGILERLDIKVIDSKSDEYTVSVPPYRVDVMQEADVIEEILRIYGFNNIELREFAGSDFISSFPAKDINKFRNTLGQQLVANGFYEILTNSLTNAAYQQKHNISFEGEAVEMLNKLSEEQGILRQTMLFTGLEVCAYNINRKQKDLKLFEFGKVYTNRNGKYEETERLAIYMSGNSEAESWQHKLQSLNYHDLAQIVNGILQRSAITNVNLEKIEDPLFDFAVSVNSGKKEIGRIGKVKTTLQRDMGIKQEVFYADLSYASLFDRSNPVISLKEVPKFPEVRRDLSLVIDKNITFDTVETIAHQTTKALLKNVNLFDVYEGDKLQAGKKAYALSFALQDEQKTLTDVEIENVMNNLIKAYETKIGAVIRK
ncbi:phenylalanine--tRNA ligase subunit beta [Chryseotalea sanaruensis]|uniref:Phenylalanine--tRNA ligase beta subunit n=1 Tax=Chryseotalea sanaruensis TaxID=2482724 RepID=A0A401UAI4_9BACT|nr:phenylalanine--tRNA ligase subunit beta [Chryseotalea sanaruensis]GCC51882.1 phenylalanine--tRNA ligase subunit beta [Chryseotalea sanaruensis]